MTKLWTPPGEGRFLAVTKNGTYALETEKEREEREKREREEREPKRGAWTLPGGYL